MRLLACASSAAFVFLAAVLARLEVVSSNEAVWASLAVALVFVPTGWWAGHGARRRLAEAMLLPAAFVLTVVAGTAMRRSLVAPLLLLAGWVAISAAWDRTPAERRGLLAAFFGLAARAAVGLGLSGFGALPVALTLALAALGPWAVSRRYGLRAAELTAVTMASLPWQRWPLACGIALVFFFVLGIFGRGRALDRQVSRWLPGLGAAALLGASISAWAGARVGMIYPELLPLAPLVFLAVLVAAPRVGPMVAGILWFATTFVLGPVVETPPNRPAFSLTVDAPEKVLPAGEAWAYMIDVGLRGTGGPVDGAVAVVRIGGEEHPLAAGWETLRWADLGSAGERHEPGTEALVWRPERFGRNTLWRSAARHRLEVPVGERPVVVRHPDLSDEVVVRVETAGPGRPPPRRSWLLPQWIFAAALAVAAIQLLSSARKRSIAVLPWMILVLASMAARAWVEPLRVVGERAAVDLALLAVGLAWLAALRTWLDRGRFFTLAAFLLIPLALATPHLMPSWGDEPYHLIAAESMAADRDLELGNNIDLGKRPQDAVYDAGKPVVHSPFLALLLLPGYIVAGRAGALVLMALAGAWLVSLLARRARELSVGHSRVCILVLLMVMTYPVATFSTQIWPGLVGALAVAAILVLAARPRGGRIASLVIAVMATAVKTRLALVAFPVAAAAWIGKGRGVFVRGLVLLSLAAAAGLTAGWLTMGHPFGAHRRLYHLVPEDPGLVARVLGGLAFDPAGGLAFTGPLVLAALAGLVALWRRGGPGERALILGSGLTVAALLHSIEWYGGGSPPARYLIPMIPAFALSGGMILAGTYRFRRLAELLLPPSVIAWWVLVTRPHLSANPGDGGYWLADTLARRFGADARSLFPSFLLPNTATIVVPLVLLVLILAAVWLVYRKPFAGLVLRRAGIGLWLTAAAVLALTVGLRYDWVVEAEAPQVRRIGGASVPPAGTFSRFLHRGGRRLGDGDGISVPLHLRDNSSVAVEGWLEGAAQEGAALGIRWNEGDAVMIDVVGDSQDGRLPVPTPREAGHHRLWITLHGPIDGAGVIDRVIVSSAGEGRGED